MEKPGDRGDGDSDLIVTTSSRVPLSDSESSHPTSGLAAHREVALTAEERAAEKKFLFKIDTIILPIIAAIYFLAALVSGPFSHFLSIPSF